MHKRIVAIVLVACVALFGLVTVNAGGPSPGHSNSFGNSLGMWMDLYWTWALGGDQAGNVKKVVFLPVPEPSSVEEDEDGITLVGEMDFTLQPGEKFVLPMFVWIGETYDDGSVDDPEFPPELFFTDPDLIDVLIALDGNPIIDSVTDDLGEYYFGPEYFESTIYYDAPTDYGAVGAVWVKGIGFVHHPLPPGEHTLTLYVSSSAAGITFINTWGITVE